MVSEHRVAPGWGCRWLGCGVRQVLARLMISVLCCPALAAASPATGGKFSNLFIN